MASIEPNSSAAFQPDSLQGRVDHALNILIEKTQAPIALGVSGGSDSLALMHLAHGWAQRARRQLVVATVDHGLRPNSAEEAVWVGEQAKRLDLPHQILHWRHAGETSPAQSQSREARHRLLYLWSNSVNARQILLGHTHDDALETFLIRARAGSRWFGLAGLAAASAAPAWPEGVDLQIVRPMLEISRKELQTWLTERGLDWISDPSNEHERYERVRMRRIIAALTPDARSSLASSLERIQRLRSAEILALRDVISKSAILPDSSITVALVKLRSLSPERRSRLLSWLAMCASGAPIRPKSAPCDSLARLIAKQDVGGMTLGDAWCAWDHKDVCFYRRPEGEARTAGAPRISPEFATPGDKFIWDGRFVVTAGDDCPPGRIVSFEHAVNAGARIDVQDELRKLGDAKARRSIPVLLLDDGAVICPSTSSRTVLYIAEMVSIRLIALAGERSATNI